LSNSSYEGHLGSTAIVLPIKAEGVGSSYGATLMYMNGDDRPLTYRYRVSVVEESRSTVLKDEESHSF